MARPALALAALLAVAGCSRQPAPSAPANVLLVLVDALRADHLGAWGYPRATSPQIDALAADGVLFERAQAQAPWTKPSIPTLFTSLYPIQHGVYEGETPGSAGFLESDVLAEEFTTLAEVFRAAGFRTGAFVNNAHLLPTQGFAQGFESYQNGSFDADEISRRFLAWLDAEPQRRFFAYLHFLDAHWPFQPKPPFAGRFSPPGDYRGPFASESWRGLRDRINQGAIALTDRDREELVARHDAAVAALDDALGRLFAALRQRGLLDTTFVLLTSDHGEELLDHGKVGHGGTLHQEVLHVPLLLRPPGGGRARRVATPARSLDVFPTLVAAAGLPQPPGLEGRDLLSAGDGEPELVAETRHKRSYRLALRSGDWKYVRSYRAAGAPAPADGPPRAFGLAAGMRLKVKGQLAADGSFEAEKITQKDAGDDDVELRERVAETHGDWLRIGPFRAEPSRDLDPERGGKLLAGLAVGTWVKVEGDLEPPGTLVFDQIELVPAGEQEAELEGIAQSVTAVSDDQARVAIAGIPVVVRDDTRIKGVLAPAASPPPAAAPPAPSAAPGAAGPGGAAGPLAEADPFAPARLLSREGFAVEEALYDLARDPAETRDAATESPAELSRLRAALDAWLGRMAAAGAGRRARREALDPRTVEELRGLGYLE